MKNKTFVSVPITQEIIEKLEDEEEYFFLEDDNSGNRKKGKYIKKWCYGKYILLEQPLPIGKTKRITLCGSTKFKKEFEAINRQLSMEGHIVYSVAFFGHADNVPLTTEQKEHLDNIHKRKIDNSDGIFVLDVDGYIGDSTRSEIEYAEHNGKFVKYLSSFPDLKFICDSLISSQLQPSQVDKKQLADCWRAAQDAMEKNNGNKTMSQPFQTFVDSLTQSPQVGCNEGDVRKKAVEYAKEIFKDEFYLEEGIIEPYAEMRIEGFIEGYKQGFSCIMYSDEQLRDAMLYASIQQSNTTDIEKYLKSISPSPIVLPSDWISVEDDRMPDHNGEVLVCNVLAGEDPLITIGIQADENGFHLMEINQYSDKVTHWMELPSPPKVAPHKGEQKQ